MSYLNTYTVKVLREIGDTMGLSFPVKARKADIVAKLVEVIDGWHTIALDANRSSHVDSPIVIDTEEFPMDHAQFVAWFNRRGGIESFDGIDAINTDHDEALSMNTAVESDNATDIDDEEIADPIDTVIRNGVKFNSGWNCCKANPAVVMTFDDGAKWAVCKRCAGTVSPKRISEFREHGIYMIAVEGYTPVFYSGVAAQVLIRREAQIKRYNPTMAHDKYGMVKLTSRQARRLRKNTNRHAKLLGIL